MIRQPCSWCSSLLIAAMFFSVASRAEAVTVVTGGQFPTTAQVIVATPDQAGFGDDADVSLAQSFQTATAFSLRSIVLEYENDSGSNIDHTVTMQIFTVADVNSLTHPEPPPPGDLLLSETVTFPAATPSAGTDTIARIILDSSLSLAANTGTEGYLLHFSGTTNPGWEWRRTGSTAGDVYAGGLAYEAGAAKSSGARDFTLALSSLIPEPTTAALAVLTIVTMAPWTRRRLN